MTERTGIHAATLKSPRLKRFIKLLSSGCKYTTWDAQVNARVCNAHTIASELRKQGVGVNCERIGRLYYYSLGPYTPKNASEGPI